MIEKDFILKSIEHYLFNQLDYEDMQFYQEQGLLYEVGEVLVRKVDMFGIDTLNSIEKSIWDIHVAKQKQNGLTT